MTAEWICIISMIRIFASETSHNYTTINTINKLGIKNDQPIQLIFLSEV